MTGGGRSLDLGPTLDAALAAVARSKPEATALVSLDAALTYSQLDSLVTDVAAGLHRLGLSSGESVALILPGRPEAITAFFGILRAGGVAVPLSPILRPAELQALLQVAQPSMLVAANRVPGNDIEAALEGLQDSLPSLERIVLMEGGPSWAHRYADVFDGSREGFGESTMAAEDDLAAVFYTTGTTGTPKGVAHSHRGLLQSFLVMQQLYEGFFSGSPVETVAKVAKLLWRYRTRLVRAGLGPQSWMTPMPLHTIAGFRVMLQALLGGHRLVLPERFHPRQTLELIQRNRVSILAVTPTMLESILAVGNLDRYDVSSLLIVGLGAAPTAPELARRAREKLRCGVVIGYGTTETGGGVLVTRLEDREEQLTETVGRPFPGVDVRIVDDERRELSAGSVGELACRVPGLMLGYRGGDDRFADVVDGEGWYYTGDLATIDIEGYVRIVGRKRDMIIRGGQNIVPTEVERVLMEHPSVEQAAVIGVPDRVAGEKVWAFVVLDPAAQVDSPTLRRFCAGRLESHKIPDELRVVTVLPTVESGEVRKADLRASALAEMAERARSPEHVTLDGS